MKLELKRLWYKSTYTIGNLYIDGIFECNTLEDIQRDVKVLNETCIPAGTYRIVLNHSNRFERVMPQILNVPGFEGIRIHPGNTEADTSGCILVGKNASKGKLIDSKIHFDALFKKLAATSESITITIT